MRDDRIQAVAVHDGASQLLVLPVYGAFGCDQRYLVVYPYEKLFFVERLGNIVVGSCLKAFYDVLRSVECREEYDGYLLVRFG